MKELVHRYLTENYYIKDCWLYDRNGSMCRDHQGMIDEFILIFELTTSEIKNYFNEWAKGLDLYQFWVEKQPRNTVALECINISANRKIRYKWVTQEEFEKVLNNYHNIFGIIYDYLDMYMTVFINESTCLYQISIKDVRNLEKNIKCLNFLELEKVN